MTAPARSTQAVSAFDISLAQAFENAAKDRPDSIAVDSGQYLLTYEQLDIAAGRLAHRLSEAGCLPLERVAILMAHDAPSIAAVVGVAKAGCVVLGLNCTDPPSRLAQLLDDAEPSVIVADENNAALATALGYAGPSVIVFDPENEVGVTDFPLVDIGSGETAALVYTSGSTGRPRGVMKTHRQLIRNVAAHSDAMEYSQADRIPLFASIGTGQGTTVLWCALLNGATLCPFSIRTKGFAGLADWIVGQKLTVFVSSASIFRALAKSLDSGMVFRNVRAVRLASESVTAVDVATLRSHFPPDMMFVHTLSSSETGNIAWHRWNPSERIPEGRIPVGHVSRDTEVVLLGEDGQPVKPGEVGELVVRTRYAAAGYWRDAELTAERFSPALDQRDTRLVRNGDLARVNPQGLIEFCGRKDSRIKIRGNRVELSDVEWALGKLPGVERAAAVAVPRENNEPMLAAFVVLSQGASWSAQQLRQAAASNLPLHMLPSRFVFLEQMPLGASGKPDRELLRQYELPRRAVGDPPRDPRETQIADIWAEALDVPDVGRDEDFFEAGGDSLRGAIVSAQIHAAFGIEISLAALAANPTVAALASYVGAVLGSGARRLPPITPVSRAAPIPLSPYQERVWRAIKRRPGYDVVIRSYEISGPLDVKVAEEAFHHLIERHEILRTTFGTFDGQVGQIVHQSPPLGFYFADVSGEQNPTAAAELICAAEAAKPIDPSTLPIVRLLLVRLDARRHWLLRCGHVLGPDASSFALILNEFAALYEAGIRNMAPPFPKEMPLQYADYAVWHRNLMQPDGAAFQEMLGWWKRIFAKRLRTTRLPRRKSNGAAYPDSKQGTLRWRLEDRQSARLDAVARQAGATHFVVRLACFVALLADVSRRSTVVISTSFTSRQRSDTRNIVGLFTNLVPLVFPYRPKLTVTEWLSLVRDRLFETEKHADIPLEELYERLHQSGLKPPALRIAFTMASEWSEQRIGDLVMKRRPQPVIEIPWGCQVVVDQKTPTNCRTEFDPRLYSREDIRALMDRYVRLLEAAAARPHLPIGMLVAETSDSRLRRFLARLRTRLSAY